MFLVRTIEIIGIHFDLNFLWLIMSFAGMGLDIYAYNSFRDSFYSHSKPHYVRFFILFILGQIMIVLGVFLCGGLVRFL